QWLAWVFFSGVFSRTAEAGRRYLSPYCRVVARRRVCRADETLPLGEVVSLVQWRRQDFFSHRDHRAHGEDFGGDGRECKAADSKGSICRGFVVLGCCEMEGNLAGSRGRDDALCNSSLTTNGRVGSFASVLNNRWFIAVRQDALYC